MVPGQRDGLGNKGVCVAVVVTIPMMVPLFLHLSLPPLEVVLISFISSRHPRSKCEEGLPEEC